MDNTDYSYMFITGGMMSRAIKRIPRGNIAGQGSRPVVPVKTINEYNIHGELIKAENRKTAQSRYIITETNPENHGE